MNEAQWDIIRLVGIHTPLTALVLSAVFATVGWAYTKPRSGLKGWLRAYFAVWREAATNFKLLISLFRRKT